MLKSLECSFSDLYPNEEGPGKPTEAGGQASGSGKASSPETGHFVCSHEARDWWWSSRPLSPAP